MATVTLTGDLEVDHVARAPAGFEWAGHQVALQTSLAGLEADWRALEAGGTVSLFQGWDYVSKWVRIAATASGEEPVFAVGRRDGVISFILPMAVTRLAGVKLLCWLGQSHSNYGMGLFADEAFETASVWPVEGLVTEIARRVGASIVHLDRQPTRWAGRDNPFATGSRTSVTANDTFVLALEEDYDTQYRRLFSGRTVSGIKRKQRKLEKECGADFAEPEQTEARRASMDWFFDEKRRQLSATGRSSPFEPKHVRDFYHALAADDRAFVVDELASGTDRIAVAMSARHGRTEYLLNTVHAGGECAKYSPGLLLQHRIMARAHAAGMRVYDFGPGAFSYKRDWEPDVVPLRARTHLVNPVALAHYLALTLGVAAKAAIKRNERLSALVDRLRMAMSRG